MKYTVFFLSIIYFFSAVQMCSAMGNRNNTLEIIKKLPIPCSYAAQYLTNDTIVIAHKGGCGIVDIKSGKQIQKISDLPTVNVAVHSNKKEIVLSGYKVMEIYDLEVNKQKWFKEEEQSLYGIFFGPSENDVFFCVDGGLRKPNIIKIFNYVSDSCGGSMAVEKGSIGFCPAKHIMCVVPDQPKNVLSIYNLSNLTLQRKVILLDRFSVPCDNIFNFCRISSDGIIAVSESEQNFIEIIDTNVDDRKSRYIEGEKDEVFLFKYFYPKGSVLLTLSKILSARKMRFWDVKTRQSIYTSVLTGDYNWCRNCDFSPDREKVIFTFANEYVIARVPFEVKYENITEDKFLYLWFLLKNIKQQGQEIPEEINLLIANITLKVFER